MASYGELRGILEAVVRTMRAGTLMRNGSLLEVADRLIDEAKRRLVQPTSWTPFEQRKGGSVSYANIERAARVWGVSIEEARTRIALTVSEDQLWVNSRYQIAMRHMGCGRVHLSIKRLDQQPIHDWRDLQRIKNELVGPECEAVELYPAESRLVDTANQFHLWADADPTFRFPIGLDGRMVEEAGTGGEGQRPFAKD